MDSQGLFQDKVVLVTGAAKGIGFAIARRFLLAGAKVAFNDLSNPALEQAIHSLQIELKAQALGFAADVRDASGVANMVARIIAHWSHIDIAVNNAGVYPSKAFLEMSEEEWMHVMDVNAKGVFLVSQAVARTMVARGVGGQIINIASGSHHIARVGSAHYCASKAAAVMLTKVMAMELAPYHIRVNAVAPGLIQVEDMTLNPQYFESTLRQIPAGRVGTPEDVAEVVFHVAQVDSDYLTGAVIAVDGGLALGRYGIPMS